ncbi:conserved hypothetical protein [Desulforapulum autotrophicum HRM2]|uniref:Lipid/polyisoprenoid-binding YceI-like domain-containing protein n=1 Tax=Desulforapulum autotrophicum (strain ATCC 43914 / DSM 3382 / VKM B-1955 / HRM2) TaxID=177437 RepID=C0QL63_DESAH|nr:YceI family protein [Desulforapulum autotrophicum]ACN14149.1 conserved hypothetical protein [Desulforapulum autotrophicum HRM2]
MKKITLFILIFLLFVGSSQALAHAWVIDANHSSIRFGVKHVFSTVWGHFSDFEGNIVFDPRALAQSSFDFTVKVKSINTANAKRDTHLRSNDFFSADRFPDIHFKSKKIIHKDGSNYLVEGTMTLKEIHKTMAIPFIYHGAIPSPFNKKEQIIGFDTAFSINRLDFGVGDGKFVKMGVVGDTVQVQISVEAVGKR